jgi:hypothetical protein
MSYDLAKGVDIARIRLPYDQLFVETSKRNNSQPNLTEKNSTT